MAGDLWRQFEGEAIDNKYHLQTLLSTGSYGGVFLADHMVRDRLIRRVAVKLMTTDQDSDELLRELVEATNLHHPHLLRCFDAGQTLLRGVDLYYLVMEVATDTLAQILRDRPLAPSEARPWLWSVVAALEYLHAHSMVHCDVKPGNLLRVGDVWKLSDFGLLRPLAQGDMVKTRSLLGSAAYMPPEGYDGVITPAWDVWSLGVTLVEALAQQRPFQGRSEAQLQREILGSEPSIPELPEPYAEIARGCLIKDYRSRWTLPQIANVLRAGASPRPAATPESPLPSGTVPPPPRAAKREPNANRTAFLWVLALLPIVLLGVVLFHPRSRLTDAPAVQMPEETRPATNPRRPSAIVRSRPEERPAAPASSTPNPPAQTPVVPENTPPSPSVDTLPVHERAPAVTQPAEQPALARREEQGAIYALLDDWTDSVRNQDVTTQVNCYAPRVKRYFTKNNVTRDQIRRDKEAVFNSMGQVQRYDIRNVSIDSLTPEEAVVSFDKDWDMAGQKRFAGSERSRLTLIKVDGRWKIGSEEEVRVYWVRRE